MPRPRKQHLKPRPDGRYACRYKSLWFYGRTEEEALQAREEYKEQEKKWELSEDKISVAEYALSWLPREKVKASKQTYKEASILLRKLLDHIGNMQFSDVKASDIKNVYSTDFKSSSDSYIKSAAQIYRSLFDAAMADGYCQTNPAREKAARPHKGEEAEGHRAITPQEREWIETLCTNHRAHAAVMAMLYAGIRPQEAKALNIDRDVDTEAGLLFVRESVHLISSNQYERTDKLKTKQSRREIPLFPPLKKALEGKSGMLVQSASGEAVTIQAWRSTWESYVAAMETAINGCQERWWGNKREHKGKEMPPFIRFTVVPYDLRYSFCTMCRENNVELNTCIHWMGHKDAKMILKVYDQYTPERGKKEAEKLEKSLFGSQKGSQKKKKTKKSI